MKIVFDTNVLISALIKEGKPRDLLLKVIQSDHKLVTSKEILEELAFVANEPKILKYVDQQNIANFLRDIASSSMIIKAKSRFSVVSEDPDDDVILRVAH